jgi:hypothetical protein
MKKLFLIICCLFFSYSQGQKVYKYYVYLYDSSLKPEFTNLGKYAAYTGKDDGLKTFFAKYKITNFDKGFPATDFEDLSRVLILMTESTTLAKDLVAKYPSIYRKTEDITNNEPVLLAPYYPNDFGNTNPNGNTGANIRRNDLDYINMPKAWEITTGIDIPTGERTKFGLSDARINDTNADLDNNKVTHVGGGTAYLQSLAYNPSDGNTAHGTAVGSIAAAEGDNNYGSVGVCYNCDIVHASYSGGNDSNNVYISGYNNLIVLAQAGARVINMSWVSHSSTTPYVRGSNVGFEAEQTTIDYINQHYNTVLVAGAGNWSSYQTATDHLCSNYFSSWGINYCFPASYDGVISVSAVNYEYPYALPLVANVAVSPSYDDGGSPSPFGYEIFVGVAGAFTNVNGTSPYNPVGMFYNGWEQHCAWGNLTDSPSGLEAGATTNPAVDILSPTANTFRFDVYAEQSQTIFYSGGGTSGSSPRVSGTVALMKTINDCLTPDEVDDILKLTSKDVESLPFNQIYAGQLGGGALDSGEAVIFVNEMKKTTGLAKIKNHVFKRFDFKLDEINNKLSIENVTFRDDNKADLTARNEIRLLPGTRFTPNQNGKIHLKINASMDISCPARVYSKTAPASDVKSTNGSKITLYPNPNEGSFDLYNINFEEFGSDNLTVIVFDLNGRTLYEGKISKNENAHFDIPNLKTGIYILKLESAHKSEEIKFIKN